jgi:VCBS repeat-containing protein
MVREESLTRDELLSGVVTVTSVDGTDEVCAIVINTVEDGAAAEFVNIPAESC